MFAKLKQKVILVDDGSNSNGVTKESVVPGRILKRNTAEKDGSSLQNQSLSTEDNNYSPSYNNGFSSHVDEVENGSFPYEFVSDELCGAISPTPVSRVRHKSIQSDNEVVKLKEEALQQANKYQEELAQLRTKEFEMHQLVTKMVSYEQSSAEQMMVIERLQDRLRKLEHENETLCKENQELSDHNSSLQKSLNVAEQKLLQDTTSWMAQISQRDEIVKRLEHTITDLRHDLQITYDKVQELENRPVSHPAEIERLSQIIKEQSDTLQEKTTVIKKQEQKLIDLQKTLRRELQSRTLVSSETNNNKKDANASLSSTILPYDNTFGLGDMTSMSKGHTSRSAQDRLTSNAKCSTLSNLQETDGFEYLKHVLVKFILSKETEAVKLLKAVAVLLKLTNDEQKLIYDTLQWRMSWFGFRPELGRGQLAKDIPPCL